MEVHPTLPGQLSTILSSTNSSNIFFLQARLPRDSDAIFYLFAYQTALRLRCKIFIAEMSFWLGNSTGELSAPSVAHHWHTRLTYKLSDISRADYRLFWHFFLSPMEVGNRRTTGPTLANILFNQELWYFSLQNEVLAWNSTGKLSAPPGAHHRHTRVTYNS